MMGACLYASRSIRTSKPYIAQTVFRHIFRRYTLSIKRYIYSLILQIFWVGLTYCGKMSWTLVFFSKIGH